MSATDGSLGICACSVEKHHFDNISVKCVFKCKGPGYKTYAGLHNHYLSVHEICLHRVAHLDPGDEDKFRRQVASVLSPSTSGNATSQRSRLSSHATQPPAASPPSQRAGPSRLGGHQAPSNLGQDNLADSPSCYAIPNPAGSPYHNPSAGLRPPVLSEVGPSRPVAFPTTRHQPYPQSRPRRQGSHPRHSPVHAQAKGKGREVPYTTLNHGPPTPHAQSPVPYLEHVAPTRPYNGYIESHSIMGPPSSGSRQAVTVISSPAQLTQVPQHSIESTVPGNFHPPATTQEHMFLISSTHESEGSASAHHIWHTQPLYHQLQTGAAMYLPTPPMDTNSLPVNSPHLAPAEQHKRPPRQENKVHKLARLNIPTAPHPRGTTQQPVSHPYQRPVKGSTTSRLARQARDNRPQESLTDANASRKTSAPPLAEGQIKAVTDVRWEQNHIANVTPCLSEAQGREAPVLLADRRSHPVAPPTEPAAPYIRPTSRNSNPELKEPALVVSNVIPQTSAPVLHGQAQPDGSRQLNGDRCIDGPPGTRTEPPQPLWSIQPEKLFQPPPGHVERPPTTSEAALIPMVQEPNQAPVPTQRHDPDKLHQMEAPSEQDDGSRKGGDTQGPYSIVSWGGWEFIKTPHGLYFPETFDPHGFQVFIDQW